ncbi:protease FtsH subunit HflK [Hasllibacter halocynthiae]|uniref:Protein HflK n=1 Tax=Hasllibacter halocynthiae TaxID=595589 RepID=A0A2T0X6W8_9RHOB|nr:FtsH protease activity modulator HflK [Hasllibacter halocynthiae]PRY94701.1 protease FtsH subunit HflK [Hasllibacter halocynthiae]
MAGNSGGPWGSGGGGSRPPRGPEGPGGPGDRPPRRPGQQGQIEIDDLVRKGQEQLRVLMGGRGRRRADGPGGGGGGGGPALTRGTIALVALVLVVLWLFASFYRVDTSERSVELFLGDFSEIGEPGLNFAPWPFVTAEVVQTDVQRTEQIGVNTDRGATRGASGLMLTTDENIVDIDFQVVWNITDPASFIFNLADPEQTIRAVSESAMREVIAQRALAPILNTDRDQIADEVRLLIQATLDRYDAGVNIVRLNLDRADPPGQVIDAFRDVQAAEQERDQLQRRADRDANVAVAQANGRAARVREEAEAYRARVVNEAEGEAARFTSILAEYQRAPEVTRTRLYLETLEEVFGRVDKIILDEAVSGGQGGGGVVPYLPLNELRRGAGESQ